MKEVIINNKKVEIDDLCVELVEMLNAYGFTTKYCCQGHNPYENFMIMLHESVSDSCIIELSKAFEKAQSSTLNRFYPFFKFVRHPLVIKDDQAKYVSLENWMIIIDSVRFKDDEKKRELSVRELTSRMKTALESLDITRDVNYLNM